MRGASFEEVLPRVAEIVADVRERGDAGAARLDRAVRRRAAGAEGAGGSAPRRAPAAGRARGPAGARGRGRRLLRATATAGRRTRGGRGRALGAALGSAGVGRRLRPRRAGDLSVLARDGGRAGAGCRGRADCDRDAESLRGDARRRARPRNRRGLRGRRCAGSGRARLRHGDDRARSTRSSAPETSG